MDAIEEPVRGSEQPLEGRCGSKLRGTDPARYCTKYPLTGRTRCDLHGGNTPAGLDSPNLKTARWSKRLPAQLAARYDELVADAEIINLGQDIGLLDVRLGQLLERLETAESEIGWQRARETFASLRAGLTSGNSDQIRESMRAMNELFTSNVGLDHTWRDVREALQERRLLVESERRRLVDMHQMVTVEEVLLLVTRIGSIITRNVDDADDRRRIGAEIQALLGPGGQRAAQALARGARSKRVPSESRSVEDGE
jgi:hypothetical protein